MREGVVDTRGDTHVDAHSQGTRNHGAGDTEALTGSSAHRSSRTSSRLQEQDRISKHPQAGVGTEIQGPRPLVSPVPWAGLRRDVGAGPPIPVGHLSWTGCLLTTY